MADDDVTLLESDEAASVFVKVIKKGGQRLPSLRRSGYEYEWAKTPLSTSLPEAKRWVSIAPFNSGNGEWVSNTGTLAVIGDAYVHFDFVRSPTAKPLGEP